MQAKRLRVREPELKSVLKETLCSYLHQFDTTVAALIQKHRYRRIPGSSAVCVCVCKINPASACRRNRPLVLCLLKHL